MRLINKIRVVLHTIRTSISMPMFKKPLRPMTNSQSVIKKIEGAKRKSMSIFVIHAKSTATRNMIERTTNNSKHCLQNGCFFA